eukprot:1203159-Rhodomonas_salina.2
MGVWPASNGSRPGLRRRAASTAQAAAVKVTDASITGITASENGSVSSIKSVASTINGSAASIKDTAASINGAHLRRDEDGPDGEDEEADVEEGA